MPTAAEALAAGAAAGGGNAGAAGAAGAGHAGAAGASGAAVNQPFWNDWADPADKDVRDWVGNKNFPDVKTMARSALGYERMIGADRAGRTVVLPADEYDKDGKLVKADEAGRKAYYAKIGVPESPDKYDIPLPAENPYPQFKTMMAQVFHENGVPARTATQLAKGYEAAIAKMEGEIRTQEDTKSQADMAELQRSWGSNYQERVALGQRGLEFLTKEVGGLSEIQQRTLEGVLGTSKFMTLLWKIGAGNQEARFAGDKPGGGQQFGTSSGDAQARLDQITAERAAGKINDYQYRELSKAGGEIDQLRDRIVQGFAAGNA